MHQRIGDHRITVAHPQAASRRAAGPPRGLLHAASGSRIASTPTSKAVVSGRCARDGSTAIEQVRATGDSRVVGKDLLEKLDLHIRLARTSARSDECRAIRQPTGSSGYRSHRYTTRHALPCDGWRAENQESCSRPACVDDPYKDAWTPDGRRCRRHQTRPPNRNRCARKIG